MSAFKILNKEGKALTMGELDKDAAEFWGKQVDNKYYANPFPDEAIPQDATLSEKMRIQSKNALNNRHNWFDVIGFNIAYQGDYTYGWQNVVHTMVAERLGECLVSLHKDEPIKLAEFVGDTEIHLEESFETGLFHTLNYYKPFVDLINHWMAKGYTPIKVE